MSTHLNQRLDVCHERVWLTKIRENTSPVRKRPPINMDLFLALAVTTEPTMIKKFPQNMENRLPNLSGR